VHLPGPHRRPVTRHAAGGASALGFVYGDLPVRPAPSTRRIGWIRLRWRWRWRLARWVWNGRTSLEEEETLQACA
jgi:hypothetical protein